MALALQKRGHEMVLACQPGSDILARAQTAGLETEVVRMRQDYDFPAAVRIARALRRRRVELLHAQHSTAHALGLLAAAFTRVPVFAVTRRVIFPLRTHIFSRLKYLSRRIDGYVAISEAVRQELLKGGVRAARIEVIPSVMDAPKASPEEGRRLRQELGLDPARPVITTVANYSDFKGQDYLVQAAADVVQAFPLAQFLLVGRDTERLGERVERLGLKGAVHLAGFRTDVPRVLAASDFFVFPSLQEAAGTALREAMAAGLPCIGARVGGIPESIADGDTGLLVPPADSPALARAILQMLRAPAQARAMAERGRAWVESHFSLSAVSPRMEAFYTRLLSGAQDGRG